MLPYLTAVIGAIGAVIGLVNAFNARTSQLSQQIHDLERREHELHQAQLHTLRADLDRLRKKRNSSGLLALVSLLFVGAGVGFAVQPSSVVGGAAPPLTPPSLTRSTTPSTPLAGESLIVADPLAIVTSSCEMQSTHYHLSKESSPMPTAISASVPSAERIFLRDPDETDPGRTVTSRVVIGRSYGQADQQVDAWFQEVQHEVPNADPVRAAQAVAQSPADRALLIHQLDQRGVMKVWVIWREHNVAAEVIFQASQELDPLRLAQEFAWGLADRSKNCSAGMQDRIKQRER